MLRLADIRHAALLPRQQDMLCDPALMARVIQILALSYPLLCKLATHNTLPTLKWRYLFDAVSTPSAHTAPIGCLAHTQIRFAILNR